MDTDQITDDIETVALAATGWLPNWAAGFIIMLVAGLLAFLLWRFINNILTRIVADRDLFWRSLVQRGARPLRLMLVIMALGFGNTIAPFSGEATGVIVRCLTVAFILCVAWIAQTALYIWTTLHQRRFRLDAEDNQLAKKHVTQTKILMRVGTILIIMVGVASALMTFDQVRQYGVSLLASAGAAGVVVGLALQSVLKNLFAGIQLAITQPIRIDDALIVEGEWGWVEEITATYVVIKIWDWRRLIVPLSYFIEKPFQNWSRDREELIGSVNLFLDHSAPIDRLREEGLKIAQASPLWDGKVFVVQVLESRERVMEIRVLVSSKTAPRTFDLRCEVREKLISFIQREIPYALPRMREEVTVGGRHPSTAWAMTTAEGPTTADGLPNGPG